MATSAAKRIPSMIYGTAWKKDRSRELVHSAILAGFRGVDTAAQPKHYQEDLVGEGIRSAIKTGTVAREDLYIQTKFTSIHGQDPEHLPYDPRSSITDQVNASVMSSLRNLCHSDKTDSNSYIDCLVLHSPFPHPSQTHEAWKAMESHVPHSVRTLGISNIYHIPALQDLYGSATIKPSVVQNRFYVDTGYDTGIRAFCREKGIRYQSFWTLTANPRLLASKPVVWLAKRVGVDMPVALYALVLGLENMSILNGTTNRERMKTDLESIEKIKLWASDHRDDWSSQLESFESLLQ